MAVQDLRPTGFANDAISGEMKANLYLGTLTVNSATTNVGSGNTVNIFRVPAYFMVKNFIADVQTVEGATLTIIAGLYTAAAAGLIGTAISSSNSLLASTNCNNVTGPNVAAGAQVGYLGKADTDIVVTYNNASANAVIRYLIELEDMTTGAGTIPFSGTAQ